MKKHLAFISLLVLLYCVAAGCAAPDSPADGEVSETASADGTEEGQEYRFIFVCPILENEYWQECIRGIEEADADAGVETLVTGPAEAEGFAEKIIGYMEEAVAQKPDGILVYGGVEAMYPLIEEACGQGIPVFTIDSDAPDTGRTAYIGTDSYHCGYQAGETMVQLTGGEAKIGVSISSRSAEKEMAVVEAFQDAVADYDIEVVEMVETDADPDIAEEETKKMLADHPEITAIFNTAGYNVTGAARVKKDQGLSNLVLLGFDDTEENLSLVRDGTIDTLIVQNPKEMGYQGVTLLKEYLDGRKLYSDSYDTGTIVVTKENVDSYRD